MQNRYGKTTSMGRKDEKFKWPWSVCEEKLIRFGFWSQSQRMVQVARALFLRCMPQDENSGTRAKVASRMLYSWHAHSPPMCNST
jgi:hypothetical protein